MLKLIDRGCTVGGGYFSGSKPQPGDACIVGEMILEVVPNYAENVMYYNNKTAYGQLPPELTRAIEEYFGLDSSQLRMLQQANDHFVKMQNGAVVVACSSPEDTKSRRELLKSIVESFPVENEDNPS